MRDYLTYLGTGTAFSTPTFFRTSGYWYTSRVLNIFKKISGLTDIHGFEKPGPPGSFLKSLWFSLLDPICKYKLVQLLLRPDRRAWRAGVYNIKAGTFRELQCIYQ